MVSGRSMLAIAQDHGKLGITRAFISPITYVPSRAEDPLVLLMSRSCRIARTCGSAEFFLGK